MSLLNKIINVLKTIDSKKRIILLIFSAKWCGPCKMLKANLNDNTNILTQQISDLKYIIFDVDEEENEELCELFKIGGIPHQALVKLDENDKLIIVVTIVGFDYQKLVDSYKKID